MKPKGLMLAVMITLALVIMSAIVAIWENIAVSELRNEYVLLTQQSEEIKLLKSRWSVEESKTDFEYLKNHPLLSKQERRGTNIYLEYDNLSSREFDSLSNKLLNSMLNIKKISLKRNGVSKGTISVEIEL
ncbi:hypothetical protein [Sulfuricurvum sp.]|uniref:hypothetical protein n=1 Tax=Sulfuricurvum sp. TaxID=2025608 RepID=UPI002E321CE5|nr:hypothetical protein [Sulfuricurvum sp.]